MENDFAFLNFCTKYSVKGTINKPLKENACFSEVFNGPCYMDNSYTIIAYKNFSKIKVGDNNGCFLTKEQVYHHIIALWKIWKFEFSVKEKIDKKFNAYYKIYVHIKGYNIIHRFILTWIRYIYEFPYSLYVLDMIKLKGQGEFKYVNQFNIFNLIASRNKNGVPIHMLTRVGMNYKIMKSNAIKTRLLNMGKRKEKEVSQVFIYISNNKFKENKCNNLTDWEKNFNKRILKYLDLYHEIKHR